MRLLNMRESTFAVLGVPVLDFTVETSSEEIFTVVGKLCISDCFCMSDICMSASFVLYEIEEMCFSLGSGKKEEMPNFREESYNLDTFLLTTNPREYFFLW